MNVPVQHCVVQTRGGFQRHENAKAKFESRSSVPTALCKSGLHGRRLSAFAPLPMEHHPRQAGIVPRFSASCPGELFIRQLNRTVPPGTVPGLGSQISNRTENHGGWIITQTGPLKKSERSHYLTIPTAVTHVGETTTGFVWVTVSRESPKTAYASSEGNVLQRTADPNGVCCTRPPEPRQQAPARRAGQGMTCGRG